MRRRRRDSSGGNRCERLSRRAPALALSPPPYRYPPFVAISFECTSRVAEGARLKLALPTRMNQTAA